MKLIALLHTADYRGDHSTDSTTAHEVVTGETVEALATRLLGKHTYTDPLHEFIEIRKVAEAQS